MNKIYVLKIRKFAKMHPFFKFGAIDANGEAYLFSDKPTFREHPYNAWDPTNRETEFIWAFDLSTPITNDEARNSLIEFNTP